MGAALEARQRGLRFEVLDQEPDAPGGSINHYPRHKVVMTEPFELPGYGKSEARTMTKEQLIEMWQAALAANEVVVRCGEKVEDVRPAVIPGGGFEVKSPGRTRMARTVLLCVGRRGSPRKLEVPGEDLPKVHYRVVDPAQYAGARVLVVGGGDAAIESAIAIAGAGASSVTLSYRQAAISRVREANRVAFEGAVAAGLVRFEAETRVLSISPTSVTLARGDETTELANDFVIVQIGGVLPTEFLARIGVMVERKFGTA